MPYSFKVFVLMAAFGGASLYAAPTAHAENDKTDASKTSEKTKREDYKSPPSPELIAQESQSQSKLARSRTSDGRSGASKGAGRKGGSSVMPAEKRKPREMAF